MAAPDTPFALGTFAFDGHPCAGLVVGDQVLQLDSVPGPAEWSRGPAVAVRDLLEHWADLFPVLSQLSGQHQKGIWRALSALRVLPPVEPRQVLQAGANYRTHVIDLAVKHAEIAAGRTVDEVRADMGAMMDRRAAEGTPYIFAGLPTAVTGPFDDVVLPAYSDQHDWELELVAVIGRRGYRLHRDEALGHVAGYTIGNDLTTRDRVFRTDIPGMGTDWFRSKNAPGFLPLGPVIVPSQFIRDPMGLRVTLALNGQVMQDESTKDMIFDVAALVAAASQTATLLPGDLVLTGSPAGNGMHWGRLLRPGDVMTGTITGLGTQRTRCVAPEVMPDLRRR